MSSVYYISINRSYARLRNMLKSPTKLHQKGTKKLRLRDIFSDLQFLRDVYTWLFFSSLLLWKLVHDKIKNLHSQTEAWW